MTASALEVRDLTVTYGGLRAVDAVSLGVAPGELVGLIGPNGAGKTTTVDAICGLIPHGGSVRFGDTDLSDRPAHRRAAAGIGRTWQSIELFDGLSVAENCQVAARRGGARSFAADLFGLAGPHRGDQDAAVAAALELVGLAAAAEQSPSSLSHGAQKLVGVARALAGSPELLLLDEPAAGLDSAESAAFGATVRGVIDDRGIGGLLIDHDTELVFGVCDRIVVLDFGQVIAAGTPEQIRVDDRVIEAYLGTVSP